MDFKRAGAGKANRLCCYGYKNSRQKYAVTAGIPEIDITRIEESVSYLMESPLEYEFRTTVTRELHQTSDFIAIGEWLKRVFEILSAGLSRNRKCHSPVFFRDMMGRSCINLPACSGVDINGRGSEGPISR